MDATQRVARAMSHTPRATHLPDREVPNARLDVPLPLFGGATNSQPSTVATMLVALDVHPGHRVLDVGAGSGWTTALLAWLVGTDGEVLRLELDEELARWGAERLARHGRRVAAIQQPCPLERGHGQRITPMPGVPLRWAGAAVRHSVPCDIVTQNSRFRNRHVRRRLESGVRQEERPGHRRAALPPQPGAPSG